jgi:alcohol dehydrogenase
VEKNLKIIPNVPDWEAGIEGYRVVFGVGSLSRLGELAREVGGGRVLVVTDPGLRAAGHVERALDALARAGIAARAWDGVESNPTTRHVDEGVRAARELAADCLVGLGGGSAMDCAKGINFLLTNGGRMEDYVGSGKARSPMLPSLGVPTTAGTGSEAQSYALVCQAETRAKMACGDKKAMFRRVVLDPALATTVPRAVAGVSAIDALSHAVESYVTTRRNPVSAMLAREAWSLLATGLPAALARPCDTEAWGRMLLGAHFAGAAIEQSMLGAAHACANPLTARFSIPHGVAVGVMLPHVVRFNAPEVGPLYEALTAADGSAPPATLDRRIRELCDLAGLPACLRDCDVPSEALPELAADAARQWTASFNPRPVGEPELRALYEAAYA